MKQEQYTLTDEFKKSVLPFLVFLATTIIWLSAFKDITKVGFKPLWFCIRLSYLPFILTIWFAFKNRQMLYEFPLWAAGFYITAFCTFFASETGGLKSDYVFGLIQLYFGIALMPITNITFYFTTLFSMALYIAINLYLFGLQNIPDKMFITTLIPLVVFSFIIYFINSRIRKTKLSLQNKLYFTIKERENTIQKQSKILAEKETQEAILTLAARVAHDIRSPLAVMELSLSSLTVKEDYFLLKEAIQKIRDIANNLLNRYRKTDLSKKISHHPLLTDNTDTSYPVLLHAAVEKVISQKKHEWYQKKCEIQFIAHEKSKLFWVNLSANQLNRILSNLLNNAHESLLLTKGEIFVSLELNEGQLQLKIRDNGCGIDLEKIPLILTGTSFKINGSGLGLSSAKLFMESIGGKLGISSEVGKGTAISLLFPCIDQPSWFPREIQMKNDTTVIIIDDDSSIHAFWINRLQYHKNKIIQFKCPEEALPWIEKHQDQMISAIFLVDYEFVGTEINGLDLLKQIDIKENGYLVTSHAEELTIQEQIKLTRNWLVPKSLIGIIPLSDGKITKNTELLN